MPRTWMDFIKDMRANALENKDPFAPRPATGLRTAATQPSAASTERAKVRADTFAMHTPVTSGIRLPRTPAPSAGTITTADGRTTTLEDIQGGFSRGGVGLRGRGSYSMVDMSQLPGMQPPGISPASRPIQPPSAPGLPAPADVNAMAVGVPSGGMPAKNYRALYSNKGARSAAMARDQRISDIMARKAYEAQTGRAAQEVAARGQDITARGQNLDFTSRGLRTSVDAARAADLAPSALAQGELYGAQADIARQSTDLFNQYQAETDPVRKASLRESYNMLQGNQARPQIHFGETESMTEEGLVREPYASTIDETGGLRVLRAGKGGASSAVQTLQTLMTDPAKRSAIETATKNFIANSNREPTPEELLALLNM